MTTVTEAEHVIRALQARIALGLDAGSEPARRLLLLTWWFLSVLRGGILLGVILDSAIASFYLGAAVTGATEAIGLRSITLTTRFLNVLSRLVHVGIVQLILCNAHRGHVVLIAASRQYFDAACLVHGWLGLVRLQGATILLAQLLRSLL